MQFCNLDQVKTIVVVHTRAPVYVLDPLITLRRKRFHSNGLARV